MIAKGKSMRTTDCLPDRTPNLPFYAEVKKKAITQPDKDRLPKREADMKCETMKGFRSSLIEGISPRRV